MNQSVQPKLARDTFFLPISEGVWFRNRLGSLTIRGRTAYRLMERIAPSLDGKTPVSHIVQGLEAARVGAVLTLIDSLLAHGFARDASHDLPHALDRQVEERFGAEIDLIDQEVGSGAHRFEVYRNTPVTCIADKAMAADLALALSDTGLATFHLLVVDNGEIGLGEGASVQPGYGDACDFTLEIVAPTDIERALDAYGPAPGYVVYGTGEVDIALISRLQARCIQLGSAFLPAIALPRLLLAGPIVTPGRACWQCAWLRIHDDRVATRARELPRTCMALLANAVAFALLRHGSGLGNVELVNGIWALDAQTLEATSHPVFMHPRCPNHSGESDILPVYADAEQPQSLLAALESLSDARTGLVHRLDYDGLEQGTVCRCVAISADPTRQTAAPLPNVEGIGMSHADARIGATLAALEQYAVALEPHGPSVCARSRPRQHREDHRVQEPRTACALGTSLSEARLLALFCAVEDRLSRWRAEWTACSRLTNELKEIPFLDDIHRCLGSPADIRVGELLGLSACVVCAGERPPSLAVHVSPRLAAGVASGYALARGLADADVELVTCSHADFTNEPQAMLDAAMSALSRCGGRVEFATLPTDAALESRGFRLVRASLDAPA